MRFVSKHANYSICFQTDVTNHFGDGNSQLVRPLLNCQFGPLGMNPWEVDAAEAQFQHKGLGVFEDHVTKEDAMGRYSVFDTEQFQQHHGLTDERRKELEAFLLGRFERGNHYKHVEKPKVPAPWPSYDDTHHKSIPNLAATTGTEEAALAYERANLNRQGVVADLEALLAPDPSIDPSELVAA